MGKHICVPCVSRAGTNGRYRNASRKHEYLLGRICIVNQMRDRTLKLCVCPMVHAMVHAVARGGEQGHGKRRDIVIGWIKTLQDHNTSPAVYEGHAE